MCVLTGKEIKRRRGEIFKHRSWGDECFQEASYDLRVDTEPVLRIGGNLYEDGTYKETRMKIMPGEMALLPTMESFDMPKDLVGDIKIKFNHSRKGLTPLFGPKVDPYFGNGHSGGERLYLWVSNLGLDPIHIKRGDRVFTVQFHQLFGEAPAFKKKGSIRRTVAQEAVEMGTGQSLGFIEEIEKRVKLDLDNRLTRVEEGTGQVVIFGVFLVASALLAGAIATLLAMMNSDVLSDGTSLDALKGSPLIYLLYWVCIALSVAVSALCIGIVAQLLKPPTIWIVDKLKRLLSKRARGHYRR